MQKAERQAAILKVIEEKKIARQEELAQFLEKRGFTVTQSSVSRDLLDLKIVKVQGFYTSVAQKSAAAAAASAGFGLLSLETSGENLIVAKCEAGLASAVAVRIDAAKIEEIVGTIAGDDTIFIAVKDAKTQKSATRKIWEIFE